ncbi:HAD-IIB family hydrolase [Thalassotalea aquiviva]|uniref:HAD-IIB family hydrolase n=1 Tax=Thalassotalea aquiviva TaxID=3242415 RepID=UPI00352A1CFD
MAQEYIISTDLDGTLLDHHTYKFYKAIPALEYCQQLSVPIIFNTSKTFAETEKLCKQLNNNHPFIIENGSALYIPKGYFTEALLERFEKSDAGQYWLLHFGLNRSEILSRLTTLKAGHNYQFTGFAGLSMRDLANDCGLSMEQAAMAKERQFSEPLKWQDSQVKMEAFKKHLQLFGLYGLEGGRYLHVQGQSNKAKPLLFLKSLYEQASKDSGAKHKLIALGDSGNDRAMLECADIAVVIQSPTHKDPIIDTHKNLIRSKGIGPSGWNETILSILQPQANQTTL